MNCSICGTIPARATANTGRDEHFDAPITKLKPLGIGGDDDLWECPACGALFLWHDDRAFTGSGNNDEEVLTRLSLEEAEVARAFVHRGTRAADDVAALADRWIALPDTLTELLARRVLARDQELARALVPRMLDALRHGSDPDRPRRFVEAFASGCDAAFVKSELDKGPPHAGTERLRALCRRLLCSICRAIPIYPPLPAPPPGLTALGVNPNHDAAECPECGSIFLWEKERGWSRLPDAPADALRACLHRNGVIPGFEQEMVIASDRRLSLKVALAHGMKQDRELIRQFVPRLIRVLAQNEMPWLHDLLCEFAGEPRDAAIVREAIARASSRSPLVDSLADRCRARLEENAPAARQLGLLLLREGRWAEAARVLEDHLRRAGDPPAPSLGRAADLHNLALARTRAGDPHGGLEAARKAVAIHEALQGGFHPDTLESMLVAAAARLETGDAAGAADETRHAATVIRSQAGEAHPFFADALLIEARRMARQGDGGAAEALARRAMFIVTSAEVDGPALQHRAADAAAIGKLWRTVPGARDSRDVALWRMSIQHTLRRYRVETLDFAPSGDRPKEWYFFVPGGWPLSHAAYAARVVFADLSRALNAREPADASFLDATQAHATPADPRSLAGIDLAGLFRQRTWEPTIAFTLARGVASSPLTPDSFARALAALGAPDAPLLPLGVDAITLAQARAHPPETLKQALFL